MIFTKKIAVEIPDEEVERCYDANLRIREMFISELEKLYERTRWDSTKEELERERAILEIHRNDPSLATIESLNSNWENANITFCNYKMIETPFE